MMRWKRKIKGKKKMNSVNEGRKVDEDEAKKENGETNKWGAKILAPTLKFCQELSQTKKKKRDEISFGMD